MKFLFVTEVLKGQDRNAACCLRHWYSIDGAPWRQVPFTEDVFPHDTQDPYEMAGEVHTLRALQANAEACHKVSQ